MGSTITPLTFKLLLWVATLCLAAGMQGESEPPMLLVLGPETSAFNETLVSVREELADHFQVVYRTINKQTLYERFELYVTSLEPKLLVLLDNPALLHYRLYQRKYEGTRTVPPAIASMAVYIGEVLEKLNIKTITGINYEVPLVSSVSSLRPLIGKPIERVGVLYRNKFSSFIETQRGYCKLEQIELVGYEVKNHEKDFYKTIRLGLRQLIRGEKVDAIWVLNDRELLAGNLLTAWQDRLKYFKKPVIVGVEPLIKRQNFGNFAVLPDHFSLGTQVAEISLEIMQNNWRIAEDGLLLEPRSSLKLLKIDFARKFLKIEEETLAEIDVLVD